MVQLGGEENSLAKGGSKSLVLKQVGIKEVNDRAPIAEITTGRPKSTQFFLPEQREGDQN